MFQTPPKPLMSEEKDQKVNLTESIENGWQKVDEIEAEDVGLPDDVVEEGEEREQDDKLRVAFVDQEVFGRQ